MTVFTINPCVLFFNRKIFVLFLAVLSNCCLIPNVSNGQSLESKRDSSKPTMVQDKRIGKLIDKHIAINQKNEGKTGFRVQIFFGSSKKDAMEIKATFIESQPDYETYVTYDSPYFKVRVGDFRTRMEAVKLQKEISEEFPGCFIVRDMIPIQEID